jgi:serine phosphatase RsbU (regulator of sigma subunit)
METELQKQFAEYLSAPGIGEYLRAMSRLSGACLAVDDAGGKTRHLCCEHADGCRGPESAQASGHQPCRDGQCPEGWTAIQVPLAHQEEAIGSLRLCARESDARLSILGQTFGCQLLEAVNHEYEMDNLSSEILSKYEELNVLYDVGESLHINMNREEICRLAVEKVQQVVGAARTGVLLRDSTEHPLQTVADSGYDPGWKDDPLRDAVLLLADEVVRVGKALLVDSRESFSPELWDRLSVVGETRGLWPILISPIKRGDHLLGVLYASDKSGGQSFSANDLKLVMAICSQAAVAISNLQMVEALKKTEALKREMDIARSIQMKMLPSSPRQSGTVSVAGRCITAANVGGDYFDHIIVEDGSEAEMDLIHLLVADVSGHDVGAALMMSVGRKVFHTAVRRHLKPSSLMREFNSVMYDDLSSSDLFITMFYAQYRHSSRSLHFSNAGHNPPFIVRGSDGTVQTMDADGMIVGVLDDVEFEDGEVSLNPGDLAVFYTDGVVEAENRESEQYGLERFQRLVQEHRTAAPEALIDVIYESVKTFAGEVPQYDDITVLILKDNS